MVSTSPTATGRCSCGRVRYSVTGPLRPIWNCHCDRCRRITGHFMAATSARIDDIHVADDTALRWYHPDDDPTVGYAFCSRCGSTLFWHSTERDAGAHMSIAAGTLDPPTGLHTAGAIFGAEASDYHRLDRTVSTHPGDHDLTTGHQGPRPGAR